MSKEFKRVVQRERKESQGQRERERKMKREFREVCRLRLVTPLLWFETSNHRALPVLQELPL